MQTMVSLHANIFATMPINSSANLIFSLPKINVIMAVMFVSPYLRLSPSRIWLYNNAIDCECSCKLYYWKSFVEKGYSKSVHDCRFVTTNFISTKMKIHNSQWMSKGGIVYLLMILNVNTYANVIFEHSLHANEGHIGVNVSILTIMKQTWTQMNGYFL